MPKITSVEVQKSAKRFAPARKGARFNVIMENMYRLFNIRQRSEKEVKAYFTIRNLKLKVLGRDLISDLMVNSVIAKLKLMNLIDDRQFAKEWVISRSKKKGVRVLKQELLQKGIDREIIEQVISDKSNMANQQDSASQLLEKKMRIWKSLPDIAFKKKAYDFLTRRGFEYELVLDIVENLVKKR